MKCDKVSVLLYLFFMNTEFILILVLLIALELKFHSHVHKLIMQLVNVAM